MGPLPEAAWEKNAVGSELLLWGRGAAGGRISREAGTSIRSAGLNVIYQPSGKMFPWAHQFSDTEAESGAGVG